MYCYSLRWPAILPLLLLLLLLIPAATFGQDTGQNTDDSLSLAPLLPKGFGDITLGLELEEVKRRLRADNLFLYRGDADVSLLPDGPQTLIETDARLWIDRALFQFFDDRLYIITLLLDPQQIGHFRLYSLFSERYGQPAALDPSRILWELDEVRLVLERPLTVKYIDLRIFEQLRRNTPSAQAQSDLDREQFLERF